MRLTNAHKLAAMLASRLSRVVPSTLGVRAHGHRVDVFDGNECFPASAAAAIVDDSDGRSLEEKVEVASCAVLNGVQDAIAQALRAEWPVLPKGGMALPDARCDGPRLHLWFGERAAPVVELVPIELSEFREGAERA